MATTYLQLDRINEIVSNYYGLDQELMFIKTRKPEICQVRQLSMKLMNEYGYSLKSITRFYNFASHKTVIQARNTIQDMLDTGYKNYINDIEIIKDLLNIGDKCNADLNIQMYSTFKQLDYDLIGRN